MDQKSVDQLFRGLSPEQQKQVQAILADKSRTEMLLNTPQARAIMKKLTGEDPHGRSE